MEMENSGALSIVNRFIISLYKVSTHVLSVYLYSSHSNVSGIVGGGGYSYKYCTRAMGYINNELTDETETTIHI